MQLIARFIRRLAVLPAGGLILGLLALSVQAGTPAALRFQPGSATLNAGDRDTAATLSRMTRLLQRYGQGSSLSLVLVGQARCPGPDCVLLRHRVDTVLGGLAADWPGAAGRFPADRIMWQASNTARGPDAADRIDLFLRPEPDAPSECGAALLLHDPALPTGLNGAGVRLRLSPGAHRIPVAPAALWVRTDPGQAVVLRREGRNEPPRHMALPPGEERAMDLGAAGAGQVTLILSPAPPSTAAGRTIADQLQPWTGEVGASTAVQAECRFRFGP